MNLKVLIYSKTDTVDMKAALHAATSAQAGMMKHTARVVWNKFENLWAAHRLVRHPIVAEEGPEEHRQEKLKGPV